MTRTHSSLAWLATRCLQGLLVPLLLVCGYVGIAGICHALASGFLLRALAARATAAQLAPAAPPPAPPPPELPRVSALAPPPAPVAPPPPAQPVPTGTNTDETLASWCGGSAQLRGAVQAADPRRSFALVALPGGAPGAYRVGDQIEGRTIDAIGWRPQWGAFAAMREPDASSATCVLAQIVPTQNGTPPAAAPTPPAAPPPRVSGLSGVFDREVRRMGPAAFAVPRALMRSVFESPAELMQTTRTSPVVRDGQVAGVRLQASGDPASWPLARLGLRDGDVLTALDGRRLQSPNQMLEAYMRLQAAPHATLTVLRDGRPQSVDYELR